MPLPTQADLTKGLTQMQAQKPLFMGGPSAGGPTGGGQDPMSALMPLFAMKMLRNRQAPGATGTVGLPSTPTVPPPDITSMRG